MRDPTTAEIWDEFIDEYWEQLPESLRVWRARKKYSQSEAAIEIGISRTLICTLERGMRRNLTMATIEKINKKVML